jgi:hypothetical protein
LRSALASATGSPLYRAPVASAPNSRLRDTASWMIMAAIGASSTSRSAATGLGDSSSSEPPR